MAKILLVIGDGAEVIDTMVPLYRLAEDFEVIRAGPAKRTYHLVQHHHDPNWDITVETPGYTLDADIAFREVNPTDYVGLVLPGGRLSLNSGSALAAWLTKLSEEGPPNAAGGRGSGLPFGLDEASLKRVHV